MTQPQQSTEVERLREKLKIAIEALEFYADPHKYDDSNRISEKDWELAKKITGKVILMASEVPTEQLVFKGGTRARQALAKLKGET